ncbi:hypothetical protein O3P69_010428 [Scylla paramamosain]|uniref:Palmitoyltransferase n=1 Tax=Scylla paramamosain TaxID=85552 RepID=A0AAW0TU94_SCYPA
MSVSADLMKASGLNTILVYFFSIEIFGNWLLFFCTKSYIDKSSGNSELAPGLSHDDCKQLRYCPTCKIYKPERSHHCSLCDRCIHQRDHHCFFLGTCVGGYNLCYFILFCFYACIGCLYSARLLHRYYSGTYLRAFWSSEFLYYFYPRHPRHVDAGQGPAGRGWLGDTALRVLSHRGLHWVLRDTAACVCPSRPDSLRVQQGSAHGSPLSLPQLPPRVWTVLDPPHPDPLSPSPSLHRPTQFPQDCLRVRHSLGLCVGWSQ